MLGDTCCSLREAEFYDQIEQLGGYSTTVEKVWDSAYIPTSNDGAEDRVGPLVVGRVLANISSE